MTLVLVRHADAGDRAAWTGDDRQRPLSVSGVAEAQAIADDLETLGARVLLSSPAVRCVQTIDPLAERCDLTVEREDRLFEGSGVDVLAELLTEIVDRDGPVVACSHGDVIPRLLELSRRGGAVIDEPLQWPKASAWILRRDGSGWGEVAYRPPPVVAF